MKTYNKPTVKKLIVRFDMELKNILTNDLKSFMAKNPFIKKERQSMAQSTLSVA